jgi:hypothetical protein
VGLSCEKSKQIQTRKVCVVGAQGLEPWTR